MSAVLPALGSPLAMRVTLVREGEPVYERVTLTSPADLARYVSHNHPSGDPEPSAEDVSLTRRLAAAGALLGVELLDHVVIGSGSERYVSLKDRGQV